MSGVAPSGLGTTTLCAAGVFTDQRLGAASSVALTLAPEPLPLLLDAAVPAASRSCGSFSCTVTGVVLLLCTRTTTVLRPSETAALAVTCRKTPLFFSGSLCLS